MKVIAQNYEEKIKIKTDKCALQFLTVVFPRITGDTSLQLRSILQQNKKTLVKILANPEYIDPSRKFLISYLSVANKIVDSDSTDTENFVENNLEIFEQFINELKSCDVAQMNEDLFQLWYHVSNFPAKLLNIFSTSGLLPVLSKKFNCLANLILQAVSSPENLKYVLLRVQIMNYIKKIPKRHKTYAPQRSKFVTY